MANYEAPAVEIVTFGMNDLWDDVVTLSGPWSGVASKPNEYSDM